MRLVVSLIFSWVLLIGQTMASGDKIIYGYVEKITLTDQNLTLSAKLDTGAKSSSLNAIQIKKIQINGQPYLSFVVPSKEGDISFQAKYVGDVGIKTRSGEQSTNPLLRNFVKRPVVLMNVQIGGKQKTIRVNLTNRKHFIYPFLLGRDAIIAFDGIIDSSMKYTLKPN